MRWFFTLFTLLITDQSKAVCPRLCKCNLIPITVNCSSLNLKEIPQEENFKETHFVHSFTQFYGILLQKLRIKERDQVETFDLSYNHLVRIGVNRFSKLKNLKRLMLSHNEIKEFYYGDSHAELAYIDLSQNLMGPALKVGSFSGLTKLKHLDLSFNKYMYIKMDLFPTNIETLKLAYNKIKFVSCSEKFTANYLFQLDLRGLDQETDKSRLSDALAKLIELKNLYVSGAKQGKIKDSTFKQMKNLKSIELEDMKINKISNKVFDKNTKLILLSLKNNSLQRIPNFSNLGLLEEFFLDHNKISKIIKNDFIVYKKIRKISLSDNNIKTVSENSTNVLKNLQNFDLNKNKLLYAQYSVHLFYEVLINISFKFNTQCDRNFSEISNSIKKVSLNQVTCESNSIDVINCTGSLKANYLHLVSTLLKNSEKLSSCEVETVALSKSKNYKVVITLIIFFTILGFVSIAVSLFYCKTYWKNAKPNTIGYLEKKNSYESVIAVCNVSVKGELDNKEENEYGSVPTSPIYHSPENPVLYAFAQFENSEEKINTSLNYNMAQDDGDRYAMACDQEAIGSSKYDKHLMPIECSIGFDDGYEVDLGVYTEIGEQAEKK